MLRILSRYEGATFSTSRSWIPAGIQSARFDASASTRLEIVRKSRYFEKNNALFNRMADLFECYTVGAGLQITPASTDEQWNPLAKFAWTGFELQADLTSRQPFSTLMGLVARTWFVDGEVFILLTHGPSGRPRIQLIESHLVGTPPELRELEGETIHDGVQVDANGRPTAYWIATESARGERTYRPVRAEFVIHHFEPSRPGQYRGLPFCYPVINDLHDLDDLQILTMKAAKDAAELSLLLIRKGGELSDEELLRRGAQVANQGTDGSAQTENRAEYLREALGGRAAVLNEGEDVKFPENKSPSPATKDHWQILATKCCTGIGMPYVIVVPDSMQGTVYRGALDMANAFFRSRFLLNAATASRIYEFVMDFERQNTPILRPGPSTWRQCVVHPPRAVNVDVGRNSQALLDELAAGTRTFSGTYGELGEAYGVQLRQRASEARLILDLATEFKVPAQMISDLAAARANAPALPTNEPDPDLDEEPEEDMEVVTT